MAKETETRTPTVKYVFARDCEIERKQYRAGRSVIVGKDGLTRGHVEARLGREIITEDEFRQREDASRQRAKEAAVKNREAAKETADKDKDKDKK